jgi:hypothetical protein
MGGVQDHFMRMLELMARALGSALNKLIGLKQISPEDSYQFVKHHLQSELNFDLDHFLKMNDDELITYLTAKSFNTNHIETLSKILFELADTFQSKEEQDKLFIKSEILLNWVSATDKTYSIEREKIIEKIHQKIN